VSIIQFNLFFSKSQAIKITKKKITRTKNKSMFGINSPRLEFLLTLQDEIKGIIWPRSEKLAGSIYLVDCEKVGEFPSFSTR